MRITLDGKDYELKGKTVADVIAEAGENRETVLVIVNGALVPDSSQLNEGDTVKLMSVVSGG